MGLDEQVGFNIASSSPTAFSGRCQYMEFGSMTGPNLQSLESDPFILQPTSPLRPRGLVCGSSLAALPCMWTYSTDTAVQLSSTCINPIEFTLLQCRMEQQQTGYCKVRDCAARKGLEHR